MRQVPRWLAGLLGVLAVLAMPVLWFLPPIYPYRITCQVRRPFPINYAVIPIDAPLRPVAIALLRKRFESEGVPYFMLGGRPWLTWLGSFDSLNFDWRIAFRIASGQISEPLPPAVARLVTQWEGTHEQRLQRYANGNVIYDEFHKLDQCAVKRAALTFADGD